MGAIFISYTSRDPQGPALAAQVGGWLREWGYESLFRDKDFKEGILAASDWRRLLHGRWPWAHHVGTNEKERQHFVRRFACWKN